VEEELRAPNGNFDAGRQPTGAVSRDRSSIRITPPVTDAMPTAISTQASTPIATTSAML
jgi:hypothetical protein